jgi:cell division protein FtsW
MVTRHVDKFFLIIVGLLLVVGFLIFSSASLGLLARDGASYGSVATRQVVLGVVMGCAAMFALSRFNYERWRKYSVFLFLFALIATALVFVPGLGMTHGGATRWLDLGFFSLQPAEILKLASVIYLAAIFSGSKVDMRKFMQGPIFALMVIGLSGALLALQPDFGTLLVIALASLGLLIAAGVKWRHLGAIFLLLFVAAGGVVATKPYVLDRITTFLAPTEDSTGSAYQISQSLIAIGSGELTGRGFGQSVQKFQFLPEPIGDSIFAVAAEEFGFLGALVLIGLYLAFAFRGLVIAHYAPNKFGGLVVLGIVILIISQSFINIASMLSLFPLTGMPLLFVSQGGTALFFALLEIGIILNISRHMKK